MMKLRYREKELAHSFAAQKWWNQDSNQSVAEQKPHAMTTLGAAQSPFILYLLACPHSGM